MIRCLLGISVLVGVDNIALACSPLPPGRDVELAHEKAAQVDKRRTSLVEAIVLKEAHWPQAGTLHVLLSHWGEIEPGTDLVVQPQPSSMCGPEHMYLGERGLVQLDNAEVRKRPVPFSGFMDQLELDAYKDRGLIPR